MQPRAHLLPPSPAALRYCDKTRKREMSSSSTSHRCSVAWMASWRATSTLFAPSSSRPRPLVRGGTLARPKTLISATTPTSSSPSTSTSDPPHPTNIRKAEESLLSANRNIRVSLLVTWRPDLGLSDAEVPSDCVLWFNRPTQQMALSQGTVQIGVVHAQLQTPVNKANHSISAFSSIIEGARRGERQFPVSSSLRTSRLARHHRSGDPQ